MRSKTYRIIQQKSRNILLVFCCAMLAWQGQVEAQVSEVRTELLRALELQLDVAVGLGHENTAKRLGRAIEDMRYASDADFEPLLDSVGDLQTYSSSLERLEDSMQGQLQVARTAPNTAYGAPDSAVTLTPPPYFNGGLLGIHCRIPDATVGIRNDTEVVLDAKIALGAAKTAWAGVEVACGLDVVALASGGLGAVACAAAAVLLSAADEIVDAFMRCDATVDEAHLDAAFFRAEDNFLLGSKIHKDLATHDSNIVGDLAAHDENIDRDLIAHNLAISAQLATHDAEIKALLKEVVANQAIIINLLSTPQGNRPEWNEETGKK